MGRIPQDTIEKIIQSSDIVDVVSEFVPLKKTGRGYSGVCPFHNDRGPSLSVSPEKQLYHCFGCGASGNVAGFLMRIRNLDYIDAIKYLAERANIKIEEKEIDYRTKKQDELKSKIYQINIDAAKFFFSNLLSTQKASSYFKDRGVDEKTIRKFGLGYSLDAWEGLHRFLKSKGYSDDIILKAGLIVPKTGGYYDRFRNRVMFPVFDVKGRVIGFGGRVLDDSKPKYLNSPETPVFVKGTNLYGLNFAIKSGLPESIIIVEGYMDCIAMHQHGLTNAVASLGTALTLEQSKLLKRYSRDIFICYDADAAGQTATLRGLEILESTGCNVRVIQIPRGKDPDEFIKNFGVGEFKNLVEKAISVTEYRIQKAREGKNLKDVREKSAFVSEAAQILGKLRSEIEIQAYASKISDRTGIGVTVILDEIGNIKNSQSKIENNNENIRNNNKSGKVFNFEPAFKKAERGILQLSIENRDFFEYAKTLVTPEDFITDIYKEAANVIYKAIEQGEKISPSELISKFQTVQNINDIALIFQPDEIIGDGFKLIDDFSKTIKKYNIESRLNELTIEIKRSEENGDVGKSAVLSQELNMLKKQLGLL